MKASQLIEILQQYEEDLEIYVQDGSRFRAPLTEVGILLVNNEAVLMAEDDDETAN